MDIFEQAVLRYIVERPARFLSTQFSISYNEESGFGGSLPDFLVIDFEVRKLYIVEVTKADSLSNLLAKVNERETRWFKSLRQYLPALRGGFESWPIHVTLFVRGENVSSAEKRLEGTSDVSVKSLDDVLFDWRWKWVGNQALNSLE